jgi:hypothetical protein
MSYTAAEHQFGAESAYVAPFLQGTAVAPPRHGKWRNRELFVPKKGSTVWKTAEPIYIGKQLLNL